MNLDKLINEWVPGKIHCSNCKHCKITQGDGDVMAYCEEGWNDPIPLHAMLRKQRPLQFRRATGCPDYASYDCRDSL